MKLSKKAKLFESNTFKHEAGIAHLLDAFTPNQSDLEKSDPKFECISFLMNTVLHTFY